MDHEPELENTQCEYSPRDWCLKKSTSIETLMERVRNAPDQKDKEKLAVQAQKVFERKYGMSSAGNGIRVLMIAGDVQGCGYARIDAPAKFLNREDDIVAFPTVKVTVELAHWADVVVWQRQYKKELLSISRRMRELGKPQIFDIDDNLHAVPEDNPAYSTYNKDSEAYAASLEFMREMDLLTVTRPELGDFYQEMTGRPYEVLPNCIDFETFPKPKEPRVNPEKIRIGWVGSTSHYEDLKQVSYAINHIVDKYGDRVEFVMMGFDGIMRKKRLIDGSKGGTPDNIETIALGDALDGVKREYHKYVDVNKYFQGLIDLDLDIAIIPLKDNLFNNTGKSNIKWLEKSAAKIPCVVTKSSAYQCVEHKETGMVAKRPQDFAKHIEYLMENEDERHRIAQNAHDHVKKNYSFSTNIMRWADLYRRVYFASKQSN